MMSAGLIVMFAQGQTCTGLDAFHSLQAHPIAWDYSALISSNCELSEVIQRQSLHGSNELRDGLRKCKGGFFPKTANQALAPSTAMTTAAHSI